MAVGTPAITSVFCTETEMGVGDKSVNGLHSQYFKELSGNPYTMNSVSISLTSVVVKETGNGVF